MEQFELNFEAGITEQYPSFEDCIKASVYGCGKPFKNIAADMDHSSSLLSRKLNENDDGANLAVQSLPKLIEATGDLRPIFWLVEQFCRTDEDRQQQAIEELTKMLPRIEALLKKAG